MKIAHVVRQFHPSFGGLEDFVRNLAQAQQQQGADVAVITLDTNFQNREKLPPRDNVDGIEVIRVPYFGSTRYPVAFSAVEHLDGFDVIHIHAIDFFVDYLSLLKRLHRINAKLIVSTHGGIFHTRRFYWLKKLFFRAVTPLSLSGATVVASSYADGALFAPVARNLRVIENGVRLQKFGAVQFRAVQFNAVQSGSTAVRHGFLFLGRFSENKNLRQLIRWFAGASALDASLHLYLAGRADTGDIAALRQTVRASGAEAAVTIAADPSDAQIRDLIAASRFVISASRYEGFGLVIPELMSYGLVPVLSAIPAFTYFVEAAQVGEIFAADQQAFTDALQRAVAKHSAAAQTRARAFAELYSWDKIARRFEAVYVA